MVRYLLQLLAVVAIVVSFSSCEDEGYMSSPDAQLHFSVDTITFDTIFTTIGSTTQRFTVHNPYGENILISRIRLSGGDFSSFRLNVNGEVGNEVFETEVPAQDSIFIFVEVTIDPNGENLPMVVQDSIEFTTNSNIQNIQLIAYGQDFELVKGETIKTTTWTSVKPYLVYDYAYVDSVSVLTIEPGTRIYFHKGAGLYVKGKILANGTFQEQIQFYLIDWKHHTKMYLTNGMELFYFREAMKMYLIFAILKMRILACRLAILKMRVMPQ